MNAPRVVMLHGPVASGKLTIAKELSALTGFKLFHNHLTVDLLLSVFPFGSGPFVRLREALWLEVMSEAIQENISCIFTFTPERTVDTRFPSDLAKRIKDRNGTISFVKVRCPAEEIERRLAEVSRTRYHKLTSLPVYRSLKEDGAFDFPALPFECLVDSAELSPAQAASKIAEQLRLPTTPKT